LVCREGVLVKCEAYGEVQVNCSLAGVPELTMSFANPTMINDIMFHPCVRFKPWESNQVLSFVPPDGQFKLISYRYTFTSYFFAMASVCSLFDEMNRVKKLKKIPIYVKPQLTSDSGNCRVSVMVGIRNDPGKPIDSITVQFQLPPLIVSADLTANHGTVDILADKVSVLSTMNSVVSPFMSIFCLYHSHISSLKVRGIVLCYLILRMLGGSKENVHCIDMSNSFSLRDLLVP
jgi:AP-3 complex subunit mu